MKKNIIGSILFVAALLIVGVLSCTQPSSSKNEEKAEMSKAEIAARQANKEWFAEMDKMENAQAKVVAGISDSLKVLDDFVKRYDEGPTGLFKKSRKEFNQELNEEAKTLGFEDAYDLQHGKGFQEREKLRDKLKYEKEKLKEIQDDKKEAIDYYKKHDIDKQSANNGSESNSFSWYLKRKQEIKKEKAKLAEELANTADRMKGEELIAKIKALDKEMKELKSKYSK